MPFCLSCLFSPFHNNRGGCLEEIRAPDIARPHRLCVQSSEALAMRPVTPCNLPNTYRSAEEYFHIMHCRIFSSILFYRTSATLPNKGAQIFKMNGWHAQRNGQHAAKGDRCILHFSDEAEILGQHVKASIQSFKITSLLLFFLADHQ